MQLQMQEMKQSKGVFHAKFTFTVFEIQTELQPKIISLYAVGANISRLILWVYGVFRPHNQPRYLLLLITDKMRLLRSTCCQGYFTPGGRRNMSASLSSAQTEEV